MGAGDGWFTQLNRRLCERMAGVLRHTRTNIFIVYEHAVADLVVSEHARLVADVGGGQVCPFVRHLPPSSPTRVVAVDQTVAAMARNNEVDERRVADVTKRIPFEDGELDVVASRTVLEHLSDVERFVVESRRVLRPGGWSIHLVPCRFAWFALVNRALGNRIARSLLFRLHSQSREGGGGQRAFYDRCYPSAMKSLFERHGFSVTSLVPSFGTNYGYSFVPLFLLTSVYEMALQGLGASNLCGSFLIVARKESGAEKKRPTISARTSLP